MIVNNNVIYADEAQTGASLRRALKSKKLPKVFRSSERLVAHRPTRKYAQSEDDIRLTKLAENEGFAVVDVVHTKKGILIRTKF